MKEKKVEYPIFIFATQDAWEKWLEKGHNKRSGVWIKFAKKSSGIKSVTYKEALDVALCYGWIDSLVKSFDDKYYIQKFTPHGAKSMWSTINKNNVARLIKLGKMQPSGLVEVDGAKKDGRWEHAYGSPTKMVVPEDFLRELKKNKKAYEFYKTLNKTNTYAISFQINTAKKVETRERRMKKFLEMMEKGEKLY